MRIDAFQPADQIKAKMDEWILTFRNAKPIVGQEKVLIPGDIERELTKKQLIEGFPVLPIVINELKAIADELGVETAL